MKDSKQIYKNLKKDLKVAKFNKDKTKAKNIKSLILANKYFIKRRRSFIRWNIICAMVYIPGIALSAYKIYDHAIKQKANEQGDKNEVQTNFNYRSK